MSKKKKLIVVSSVLAACMLCSLSVLALSGQEETESVDENSAVALSKNNAVQSDVLEKVVSEEIGDEQMTEVQKISALSTVATCKEAEAVLGEPISTRGSYDLSDEWSTVTKIYKANSGKEVKVTYYYDTETDTEEVASITLSDGAYIVPGLDTIPEYKDYSLKTDLTTEMFEQFVENETTAEEVLSIVGIPHANLGYGHIMNVYYTTDGNRVSMYWGNGGVIDTIHIYQL